MSDKDILMKLRRQTGAGILDIKEALGESGNDEEKAIELLRKKGQKIAAKRADREAGEGWIGSYVHANGKVAAVVKLQCETDFVARNEEFQKLAYEIAMHIVGMSPMYVAPADIPAEAAERERALHAETVEKEGKPAEIAQKIITGKLEKWYEEICLLNQKYIKDDSKTVGELVQEASAKTGEKIEVTEFSRLQI